MVASFELGLLLKNIVFVTRFLWRCTCELLHWKWAFLIDCQQTAVALLHTCHLETRNFWNTFWLLKSKIISMENCFIVYHFFLFILFLKSFHAHCGPRKLNCNYNRLNRQNEPWVLHKGLLLHSTVNLPNTSIFVNISTIKNTAFCVLHQ